MGRYQFRLATEEDDAGLRALMAATPMDGRIALRFLREPSFFDAASVDGTFRQIAVCCDGESGQIAGVGTRSVRPMFVNGAPAPVGYLSGLRSLPGVRSRGLLASGYRFLKELHGDGRTCFYLSTIAEGNERALHVLTSGRAGLPGYYPCGSLHTFAIPVPRRKRAHAASVPGVEVRPAHANDVAAILAFLRRAGPALQFFPEYREEDFFNPSGTFRDLKPEQVLLAFRAGHLAGILAGWDQSGFKQTVVERYSGPLRWLRPLYDGYARIRNLPGLPRPGGAFHYIMGALPLMENNDPVMFAALIRRLLADLSGRERAYLLVALHESHPLLPVLVRRATTRYVTRLYCVCWEDPPVLDGRTPYLELGCL